MYYLLRRLSHVTVNSSFTFDQYVYFLIFTLICSIKCLIGSDVAIKIGFSVIIGNSLARPIVRNRPIQRNFVTQKCIVAIFLPQVFGLLFFRRQERCWQSSSSAASETLDESKRLGQTC